MFRGEYWYDGSHLHFCDGDSSVETPSHELFAQARAVRELCERLGIDIEEPTWEVLESAFDITRRMRMGFGPDPKDIDAVIMDKMSWKTEEAQSLLRTARRGGRVHARRYWNWVWCSRKHFAVYRLDEKNIQHFEEAIDEILDQEGIEDEDIGETVVYLTTDWTGAQYTIAIKDILSREWRDQIHSRETQIPTKDPVLQSISILDQVGPNAQLAAADRATQPSFYHAKVIRSRKARTVAR